MSGVTVSETPAMRPALIGAVLMACLIATGCTQIKTVADKVGAELSGWFDGRSLYSKMTREDVRLASITMQETLEGAEDRAPRGWSNRHSGNSGMITPLKTDLTESGAFCRDYRETIIVRDRAESYLNRACRDANGVWQWVD
jgi:surface antigen